MKSPAALVALPFLLVLPGLALWQTLPREHLGLVLLLGLAANAFTLLLNWSDKRRAGRQQWRVPEATLHLGELFGGWPGALLAQQLLRHKTAKAGYQFWLWGSIVLHQTVALDALLGWKILTALRS